MESLKLDTPVTRVTKGKEQATVEVRELEVGDEFVHDSKRWGLVTESLELSACDSGDRVRYQGSWCIVWRHGRENVLFPLPNNKPLGKWEGGENNSHFPFPGEMVHLLTFKELAVARPHS